MHHQRTKPVDVAFHPLISEAYDLCRAIEKCGASTELTNASVLASALMDGIANLANDDHDRGGWYGTNTATGREIRIRTAARLRSEAPPAQEISPDEARRIVDEIKF